MEKRNRMNSFRKMLVLLLILVFMIISASPLLAERPGDCETAMIKCLVAAAFAASDPYMGVVALAFCGIGYAWCKEFYNG